MLQYENNIPLFPFILLLVFVLGFFFLNVLVKYRSDTVVLMLSIG